MNTYKCKLCGGELDISPDLTIAECQYCGTKQTLPKIDSDRRRNMYDRAGHFRRNNEFDKALGLYEQILNEDNTDAEAYWSIVLCRYGIEYVVDPSTGKRVPTVNRTQLTSIYADEDYKSAIEYADPSQRELYKEEAEVIDKIQKGILEISNKEESFDVFICYKETDSAGQRTRDFVLATDLYHELTKADFKVFFSRITLEDKLGSEFEPYIFAALNSAKIMVVLGTKPEYFTAPWVKNEWSRFLALIKKGENKILIPAYKDMDPYDLPDEFSHLQAQDMSKLGFIQDIIHGIKKLANKDKPKQTANAQSTATVAEQTGGAYVALTERAFMCLEDGDFQKADDLLEQALNTNPKYGWAYLGKLMIELKVKRKEALKELETPFDSSKNYQRAVQYGDDSLKTFLNSSLTSVKERQLEIYLRDIFEKAHEAILSSVSEDEIDSIVNQFKSKLVNIKYSKIEQEYYNRILSEQEKLRTALLERTKAYEELVERFNRATTEKEFDTLAGEFAKFGLFKESEAYVNKCKEKIDDIEFNCNRKIFLIIIGAIGAIIVLQNIINDKNHTIAMNELKKNHAIAIDNELNNLFANMVSCPAGSFMMGSPENELGRKYDEKYHQVTLTKDFLIGKFPVTQALYKEVLGSNPSKFTGENNPVENVNWYVAKLFCHILNKIYAPLLPRGYVFDLPTEAQWEYACRAGTTTALNNGKNLTTSSGNCLNLNEIAWHHDNSGYKTHPVGQKKPNEWGIYDMLGNVWEWCRDSYGTYPSGNVTDPIVFFNNRNQVLRGGAWFDRASYSRSASRYDYSPDCSYNYLGFRLALVPNS